MVLRPRLGCDPSWGLYWRNRDGHRKCLRQRARERCRGSAYQLYGDGLFEQATTIFFLGRAFCSTDLRGHIDYFGRRRERHLGSHTTQGTFSGGPILGQYTDAMLSANSR